MSHLREGVFLGKFGIYSIARNDTIHWDLIDSDWGGGGQYAGAPGRLSKYLYKQGFAELGWNILQRHMRYIDYFPYLPQNPRTDSPGPVIDACGNCFRSRNGSYNLWNLRDKN